jgi:8-oxo-dGTP diphosphatase
MTQRRRRGTAIVETNHGILVTSGHGRVFILPGGAANRGESRLQATIRELKEETGLDAYDVKYLFRYVAPKHKTFGGKGYFRDYHKVFLIRAKGKPMPRHEIKHIAFYNNNNVRISFTTNKIIGKYYEYKRRKSISYRLRDIFRLG